MAAKKFLSGIDLANQKLANLADGSAATDAVTLQQLQAYVRGLDWKESVRAASTANVTVTAPGASIDGVTLATGDRVLLKNQTAGAENGIYQFNGAASALTRTADASSQDGVQTLTSGTAVLATEGTVNADTAWVLSTHDPIVVGTTALTFAQFGGGATYSAGNGLSLSSGSFSVVAAASGGITVSGSGISIDFTRAVGKYAASVGDGSTTSITVTHNLNTRDVVVALYDNSSFAEVETDIVHATVNTITLNFATAPASNAYRVVVHG